MNNFQKSFSVLAIMLCVAMATVFVVQAESVKASSLQNSKPANNSLKVVRKHIITPNQARNFLNDLDMPTRDYEKTEETSIYGKYEADSDRFMLETRDSNRFLNNLSYSVFGDKYVAKAVELDLNVNDLSYKSNAVGTLIKYSDALMIKVMGKHLTPEIKKAMQTKTNKEWIIDGYKIKVKSEIFPDEKVIKGLEPTSDHGAFSLSFLIELFN